MRVVLINKSDTTGGAAVVSRRLMEALRNADIDARMLVAEKKSDSPFVELAAQEWLIKEKFLAERLKIFISNGFNRSTLFKIDTGETGLPLWKHPRVKEADVIMLNWVNQGMLSLKGVGKLLASGKPVIWTMHDLWCMTGICHHSYNCTHFKEKCGLFTLLGKKREKDLSRNVWTIKNKLYHSPSDRKMAFVAVSQWLAEKASESSLLKNERVEVIPNAFPIVEGIEKRRDNDKIRILFGAARLDDPVKGFNILQEVTKILREKNEGLAREVELVTFGGYKDPSIFEKIAINHRHLGTVKGEDEIRKVYLQGDIVLSTSLWETLPTTLVEAQMYGCIPVSFNRGGQSDIISHLQTGYIAEMTSHIEESAENITQGVIWAIEKIKEGDFSNICKKMKESAESKFSSESVANQYISLMHDMLYK